MGQIIILFYTCHELHDLIGQYGSTDRGIIPRIHARIITINRERVGKELLAGVADKNLGSVQGKSGIE